MLNSQILFFLIQQPKEDSIIFGLVAYFLAAVLVLGSILLVFNRALYFFEMAYVEYVKKQLFFNHVYLYKKSLSGEGKSTLKQNIKFYNNLSPKHKSYFEHRVHNTMHRIEFIGKQIEVTNEMKIIVSATLVKLTFGLRDYKIGSVERIIIYPEEFYSQTNKAYHKGEFNPGYRALVFSWKDVVHGYHIEDDNLNLAVHEFVHAMHLYYMSVRKRNTSAAIFADSFYELTTELDANSKLKEKLVSSEYLRDYAFTNQFEFLAVMLETFIETPQAFKSQFPEIYNKVKEMLNFNFSGY